MKKMAMAGLVCLILLAAAISGGCTDSPKGEPGPDPWAGPGIRVITENFPPFSSTGPDGIARGQSTEIVNEIARRQNESILVEVLPWADGYRIAMAEPDVALFSTVRSADRENLFRWVGPIGTIDYQLYARNGSGIRIPSLEAAKRSGTIGVVRDDIRHQFLQSENVTNLTLCRDDTECAQELLAGSIDLWLGSSVAAETSRQAGIEFSSFQPVYLMKRTELYIAFNNRTPAGAVAAWQATLDAMKRDGTYDRILSRYRPGTAPAPAPGNGSPAGPAGSTGLVAAAVAQGVDGRLTAVLRPLEVLALTEEARSGNWDRIRPLLAGVETGEPAARLWYARPDGSYYTTVDNLTTANLLNRPYFPSLLAGRESVGTIVSSHTTGRNVVIVAVPVREKGHVVGALGASVYLDSITAGVNDALPLPENLQFFAVDPAGTVAIHSDNERIFQNDISAGTAPGSSGAAVRGMLGRDSGTLNYDAGGRHWVGEFRTSTLTGWHIAVVSAGPR